MSLCLKNEVSKITFCTLKSSFEDYLLICQDGCTHVSMSTSQLPVFNNLHKKWYSIYEYCYIQTPIFNCHCHWRGPPEYFILNYILTLTYNMMVYYVLILRMYMCMYMCTCHYILYVMVYYVLCTCVCTCVYVHVTIFYIHVCTCVCTCHYILCDDVLFVMYMCMYMCMYMTLYFIELWSVNPMYVHVYVHVTIFYIWWCIMS